MSDRCWCGDEQSTGGHRHEPVGVADLITLDQMQQCSYGHHVWLPWLRISPESSLPSATWVTRCVHCGKVEQWDV